VTDPDLDAPAGGRITALEVDGWDLLRRDGLNGGRLGAPPVASPGQPIVATFEIAWR
jgi:hypothetical protein